MDGGIKGPGVEQLIGNETDTHIKKWVRVRIKVQYLQSVPSGDGAKKWENSCGCDSEKKLPWYFMHANI